MRNNNNNPNDDHDHDHNNVKEIVDQKVLFYKLFSFADSVDIILMIVGSISAIANGVAQPLMTLVLGQIINSFGSSDPKHVVHDVSQVPFFIIA